MAEGTHLHVLNITAILWCVWCVDTICNYGILTPAEAIGMIWLCVDLCVLGLLRFSHYVMQDIDYILVVSQL